MAPRRSLRATKIVNNVNYSNISLCDVLCPICRSILIQPVTLPCNHDFCYTCFEGTLANANLTCPLCRVRFGSWHRVAKKDNKIVNSKLWDVLQAKFPRQVKNRLHGIEENLEEETPIALTTPGEIRKEYEEQKRKEKLELQKLKEEEEKASAELIRKLQEAEEYERILKEEKMRLDEQVARKIAKELNSVTKPSASKVESMKKNSIDIFIKNMKHGNANKVGNKSQNKSLPQYLSNIINQDKIVKQKKSNFTIEISDSNDSIENECKYFKPIDYRNIPPSKTGTILKVPAIMKKSSINISNGAPSGGMNFSHSNKLSAFARFTMSSPILGVPSVRMDDSPRKDDTHINKKRKTSDKYYVLLKNDVYKRVKGKNSSKTTTNPIKSRFSIRKQQENANLKLQEQGQEYQNQITSPFFGFETNEIESPLKLNGKISKKKSPESKVQQQSDFELAKQLQEEYNKESWYTTRSRISCRENLQKSKQLTLTEIMSTSKCK